MGELRRKRIVGPLYEGGVIGIALVSLFGGVSLHIYALQVRLLGSIAYLGDSTFIVDQISSLLIAASIAGLAGRFIYFVLPWSSGFLLFDFVARIFLFAFVKNGNNEIIKRKLKRKTFIHYCRHQIGYSIAIGLICFWLSYLSVPGPGELIIVFVLHPLIFVFPFVFFSISRKESWRIKKNQDENLKFHASQFLAAWDRAPRSMLISSLSLSFLFFCWWTGVDRAEKLANENRVYVQAVSMDSYDCYYLLGKSSAGVFLRKETFDSNKPEFYPFDSLINVGAISKDYDPCSHPPLRE